MSTLGTTVAAAAVEGKATKTMHTQQLGSCQLNLSEPHRDATCQELTKLVRDCPDVEDLKLGGCRHLTDEGLNAVAEHCAGLKHLSVSWC